MTASANVAWVMHDAGAGSEPKANHLITHYGLEAYGRYWRLVELLMAEPSHQIGGDSGGDMVTVRLGLEFADDGEAAGFVELLAAYGLTYRTEDGGYRSPIVDEAAERIESYRERGRKGGLKASANRRASNE